MGKPKALVLFSGGLDSILSAKILQNQNISVTPVCFKSFFFGCDKAKEQAKKLGLKLKEVDVSREHFEMLRNPKRGYGKAVNPCIDCRELMLKRAGKIMKREGFDFIATGEVLGQRPMSQKRKTIALIESSAGLKGRILRPLSAKLFSPTDPERKGLVKRENLFSIKGRSRKEQIALAEKYGIRDYSAPAGGCILTDLNYAKRLKKLLEMECEGKDAKLLRLGRVFWEKNCLILVGRDEKENKEIAKLKKKGDILFIPENFPGPTVLIRCFKGKPEETAILKGRRMVLHYSKASSSDPKIKRVVV